MEFTLKTTFKAAAKQIFDAWLNSESHSEMTGGEAQTSNEVGAKFYAWDGYIEGTNLVIEPNSRIAQTWRTSEFEANDEDSQIEVLFSEKDGSTELTLIHTGLSESGEQYINGWKEHYFAPMKENFGEK